jgi:hypothetical protein
MKLKALSVKQPFAYLIATGQKTIETRTWKTNYRGDVLICSGKTPHTGTLLYFERNTIISTSAMRYAYQHKTHELMQMGKALCIARLVGCRKMNDNVSDRVAAWCEYQPDTYAWVFEDVRPVDPFPIKGQLGLWDVTERQQVILGLIKQPA